MTKKEQELKMQDEMEETTEEIDMDDFLEGDQTYIKNPSIGDSVEFELKSIRKAPKRIVQNPKTGKNMDICLSNTDYFYELIDSEDKTFQCMKWQLVGKLKAIGRKLKSEDDNLKGQLIRIDHVADGRETDGEIYKVSIRKDDGKFYELPKETNEWIELEVSKLGILRKINKTQKQ